MKSDVKAVRVTGTGTVFAGRTRLRGLILASDGGGAGTIILPGAYLKEGTAIGANSVINKTTEKWTIYAGSPSKKIKKKI